MFCVFEWRLYNETLRDDNWCFFVMIMISYINEGSSTLPIIHSKFNDLMIYKWQHALFMQFYWMYEKMTHEEVRRSNEHLRLIFKQLQH